MGSLYQQPDYLTTETDYLANMDFFCIAVLQTMRDELIVADLNETMMIFLGTDKQMADSLRLISISERVKFVLKRKLDRPTF
jgi:hypothetical protein